MMRDRIYHDDVKKFSDLAADWWDPFGPFHALHALNRPRIIFIQTHVNAHFKDGLSGVHLLDVGCGGGLLCEPMARLGARVSGVDLSEEGIRCAQSHAEAQGLEINYCAVAADQLADQGLSYDVVTMLELVEHVSDRSMLFEPVSRLVRSGGLLLVSSLNRTLKSYCLGIVMAERVLKWVPEGTHDYQLFVAPDVLQGELHDLGFDLIETRGMSLSLFNKEWGLSDSYDVNFIQCYRKR